MTGRAELRTQALDYGTNAASNESGLHCKDKTKALQSAADETDINLILKRMGVGIAPPVTARIPMSGDFTEVVDYRTALHQVMAAETAFMQLPAEVRFKMDNDPQRFLDFMDDPNNGPEMVRLGLAVPRPSEAIKDDPKPKEATK